MHMNWEPWTGCYKLSDGCTNCYFYGLHAKHYGQNTIQKTDKFDWPVRKNARNTGPFLKRDGKVKKVNPFKQTGLAKELDIHIADGKRLF
ncbi:DUF5131 family protein [Blautia pseudococcoides]|nr:DUF5131 family protein [Blautia pseudococcoides]QQQ94864.1 DUF5131 family protein [Blautia pseudococcoides]